MERSKTAEHLPTVGWVSDEDLSLPRKPVMKLIVVGDGGVGKTTIIHRYLTGTYLDQRITIGSGFATRDMDIEGVTITLSIWDFAGEPRFRFLMPHYCQGSHGCILAFDLTRPPTFRHLEEWLQLVRENTQNIPVLLIGTKLDIVQIKQPHPDEFVEKHRLIGYLETSSKWGINVAEAFEIIANQMWNSLTSAAVSHSQSQADLSNANVCNYSNDQKRTTTLTLENLEDEKHP